MNKIYLYKFTVTCNEGHELALPLLEPPFLGDMVKVACPICDDVQLYEVEKVLDDNAR